MMTRVVVGTARVVTAVGVEVVMGRKRTTWRKWRKAEERTRTRSGVHESQ